MVKVEGKMMTHLKIKKTHPDVVLPKFATEQSACFDLACQIAGKHGYEGYRDNNKKFERTTPRGEIYIGPGERVMVPTGLILDIPKGYSVRVYARSGTALKQGLVLINSIGIIDSDYTQELFLLVFNASQVGHSIKNGERIAQGELVKTLEYVIEEKVDEIEQKTTREGGFGSTGKKQFTKKNESVSAVNN